MHITITTGTIIRAVLVLAGAWLLFTLRDIVLNVLAAVVIASAIEPGVAKLMRNGIPRVLSVITIYLLLLSGFFCLFYFFVPSVIEDITAFIHGLPMYLDSLQKAGVIDQYAQLIGSPSALSPDEIIRGVRSAIGIEGVFDNTFAAISTVFGGLFSLVFIVVFSFYFALAETGMDDFLNVIVPRSYRPYALNLWTRSRHKIGLWMQGQLLLGVIIGVLIYLGLTILGVQHALVLAVIAGVFELIPVFGPTLSAIPAVAIAFAQGGATLGLLTIGLYVIAQQFENHLIYPLVVTRVVGVPPLLIILALLIGGQLAGFLGIVLSVPASAVLQELVRDLHARRVRPAEDTV